METNPVDEARESLLEWGPSTDWDDSELIATAQASAEQLVQDVTVFEQAIRQEERSRYEGLRAAVEDAIRTEKDEQYRPLVEAARILVACAYDYEWRDEGGGGSIQAIGSPPQNRRGRRRDGYDVVRELAAALPVEVKDA